MLFSSFPKKKTEMVIVHCHTETGLQAEPLDLSNPYRLHQAVWLDLMI